MQYLKADTITEVTIGPAVAVGDGFTPVTSLTIASADEAELIKHGATTSTAIAGTVGAVTNADGYYTLDLSATDTNTEGRLTLLINDDSLILPIRHEFMVVNANVFDSLFAVAGTDLLQVDQTEVVGGAVPAPTTTGVPDVNVERWLDTLVTLSGALPDVNVEAMDADSIATGVMATDSIGALAMAAGAISDGTIAAAELTNIENEIWDALKSAHVVANSFGDFLDDEITSRQVSGDVTIAASGIPVGAFVAGSITAAAIAAAAMNGKGDWNIGKTGYSLTQTFPANFADMAIAITTGEVDANLTEYLGAATPALVGGRFDSSVGAMAANVITAAAINAAAITAAKFAAGAIDANALATAAITAAKIATDAIGATELAADAVTKIRDAILPVQNIALPNIPFTFVAASDHVTPVTGATGTAVTRSIDGGGFGAGTGTISEVANGAYSYDASAADMNGGIIMFRFTGTGGTPGAPDDTFVSVITGAGV